MRRVITLSIAVTVVLAVAIPRVDAHPVHATIGEAVWNPDKRALELSIRVRAVDLKDAVGSSAALDLSTKDPERVARDDGQILSYLERRFKITRPDGGRLALKWLGKEFDAEGKGSHLWLHFWVEIRDSEGPLEVTNRIFFELDDSQVNTLLFRRGKDEWTTTYSRRQPSKRLPIPHARDGAESPKK